MEIIYILCSKIGRFYQTNCKLTKDFKLRVCLLTQMLCCPVHMLHSFKFICSTFSGVIFDTFLKGWDQMVHTQGDAKKELGPKNHTLVAKLTAMCFYFRTDQISAFQFLKLVKESEYLWKLVPSNYRKLHQ